MDPDYGRSLELARAYEALQRKTDEHARDLEAARLIQLQLLPQDEDLFHEGEVDFAGYYQAKDKVGGDLYDFFRIGMNSCGFLVADVSGHGLPSALLTMFLKAAFRTRVRWGVPASTVCREVNSVLYPVVRDLGLFATAFFAILDLESGRLRYAHCGHPPVFVHRARTGTVDRLEERGMILGPFDDTDIPEDTIDLEEGDTLISVTDGIVEARNFRDEMFGTERLLQALTAYAAPSPDAPFTAASLLDGVRRDWEHFTLKAPPADDVTLAALRFLSFVPSKTPGA